MAETKLIMTNKDAKKLVEFILHQGSYLVSDCNYDSPEYELIYDVKSFLKYHEKSKLFFIINEDWILEPLKTKKYHHKTEGEKYYIVQKTGGPSLDFFFTGEYKKDDEYFLGSGFLGYHSKFWCELKNDYVKAPESLKGFYKLVITTFKKDAVPIKGECQTYWSSKEAADALDTGAKKLSINF